MRRLRGACVCGRRPRRARGRLCHAGHAASGGDGGDDVVGGVGEVGEAVGQAGAGEDEVVGVLVFGGAELGQQVQVVAQGLQFGVGGGGQVVAGVGGRSVRHGGVLPCGARRACGRALRPQGVGRFETARGRRAYFPCGCCISRPPDAEQTASDVPMYWTQKTHQVVGGGHRHKRSFDAPWKRVCIGGGGVSIYICARKLA